MCFGELQWFNNFECSITDINNCSVSGTVAYNNLALDPLAGFTVTINGHSANTDAAGAFTVNGVTSGVWTVFVNPNGRPDGGINSTDAGAVNYWFANQTPIQNVRYLSGDVNMDLGINAADALTIQRYFVLGQPFTRPPWVFWNSIGAGTSIPPAFTIPVNGVSVTGVDVRAMCTGDFNASFTPNSPAKGESKNVTMITGDIMDVAVNKEFELPVKATSKMNVGAVSLILNIPTDLVEVKGAYLKGSNTPVTFGVSGNEVRIGWNSVTSVVVDPEGELVVLVLKALPEFLTGKTFEVSLVDNTLNELADARFDVIQQAVLKADVVRATNVRVEDLGKSLQLNSYPNPTSGYTNIYYTLPADGKVTLELHNAIGENIRTLADANMTAGKYSVKVDASSLPQGIYMATLKLRSNNADMVRTIKLIVNK